MTDERKVILDPEIAKKALKMQGEMKAGTLEMQERNRRAVDDFNAFVAAHNYSSDELSKASANKEPVAGTNPNGDAPDQSSDGNNEWMTKCPAIAQRLGEIHLAKTNARQINASSMCEAVAEELGLDPTTHGRQGPRSSHNVRTEGLKGWKFRPPNIVKKVD